MSDEKYHYQICNKTKHYVVLLRDKDGEVVTQYQFGQDYEDLDSVQHSVVEAFNDGRISNEDFQNMKDICFFLSQGKIMLDLGDFVFDDYEDF